MGTEYVQAWEWSAPGQPGGYVYTPKAALDRVRDGCDVRAVTIVRHTDGSREYLRGALAHEVRALLDDAKQYADEGRADA